MKKIISLILIFTMLFSINIYADDKKDNISTLEGIILEENGTLKFATSKNTYLIESEDEDMINFLNVIANEGVKVFGEGVITDNKINLTYTETTSKMSADLQAEYEAMLMNTTGLRKVIQDLSITKKEDIFCTTIDKKEYLLTTADAYIKEAIALLADTETKVELTGLLFNDKFEIVHLAPMKRLTDDLLEQFTDILNRALAEKQKKGVIISEGKDSYLLVESNTNKMYYLKTDDNEVRGLVPIIANCGQKVILTYEELSNGMLNVFKVDFDGEIEKTIEEDVKNYKKKVVESTRVYELGKIKKEGEDYNLYFTSLINGKEEKYGLIATNSDVVAAIKTLANKDIEVKIVGFLNYEKTLFDVRTITINEKLSEEQLKQINEEISSYKKENSSQSTNKNNAPSTINPNNSNNTNTQDKNNTTNQNTNTPTNNTNQNMTNNLLGSNFGNFSSFFSNFDMSNFGNFNGLLGNNQNQNTNNTTQNNSLFNNFNSMFNNNNISSLFSNFGNFNNMNNSTENSSGNSLFGNFNFGNLFSNNNLLSNFNSTGLFANFDLASMFSGMTPTQNNNSNNDTSTFANIDN